MDDHPTHDGPRRAPDAKTSRDEARERRIEHRSAWVEHEVQQAMRRGDFDDLPGAGKPLEGLDNVHDPDWWIKRLVERERISVLPPALALRTEDLRLDDELDRLGSPDLVRARVADFNARIVDARRQLQGGPPVITPLRDPELEVTRWHERRTARHAALRARLAEATSADSDDSRGRWRRLVTRLLRRDVTA